MADDGEGGRAVEQRRTASTAIFNYRNRTWEPFNFGFTTAADPRTWIGIKWKNPLSTIGWTSTLGQTTVLQTRFGFALFDLVNYEPNAVPGTPVYIETEHGVISGGPNGNFGVQNRDRYALKSATCRSSSRTCSAARTT